MKRVQCGDFCRARSIHVRIAQSSLKASASKLFMINADLSVIR